MEMEEATESCVSRAMDVTQGHQGQHRWLDVCNEVLRRLRDAKIPEASASTFGDELWDHFHRLPARYALDVNVDRAEDVLMHKKLFEQAKASANQTAFAVRVVQISPLREALQSDSSYSETLVEEVSSSRTSRQSIHPPPAFGSSVNLEALALEASKCHVQDDSNPGSVQHLARSMHEITFSSKDKPKLLYKLTSLLGELGLNIWEANIFSTNDGYSLDVFVVDGWHCEETEQLKEELEKGIQKIEAQVESISNVWSPLAENMQVGDSLLVPADHVKIPTDGTDVWELDVKLLSVDKKLASGSYGDVYHGTYCSQDVAVKVLNPERINLDMQQEFAQEVYIMRKVRHKNVVQFIGACTKTPSLCIVTEYMSGGSVYDYLHKKKRVFNLPTLLRVALDISKGMNFLHQNNIIHRDLKSANLLMDEKEVVKVADFGVARVKVQSGIMTAETGTYRWMAPEVIEHRPYDQKADVFSFGVLMWELLTGKIPYEHLTPLQAALGVVQKRLRPTIPKNTHPKIAELLEKCWQHNPTQRPEFSEIIVTLQNIAKEVEAHPGDVHKEKSTGGFLSILKRGH
ncbi:serine/threonine-protein kinase STY46-like isoform X2 [Typha latifolia]|uniref:serine/threonine-protein kinase STY46-like isoform X2 n=1 Tax=Typha latifolia TaxID=4733 RepID=UPI003C2F3F26